MARPRGFESGEVLDRAKAVFWANGYEGSSIGALAAATGLKTGSLYNAFGNKHALYLKTLDRYGEREIAAAVAWIERQDCRGAEAVAGFLKTIAAQVESGAYRNGCFLCNAAVDRAAADSAVAARIGANLAPLRRAFHEKLRADPRTNEAATMLADFALAAYLGMFVMIRGGGDGAMVRRAVSVASAALSV